MVRILGGANTVRMGEGRVEEGEAMHCTSLNVISSFVRS
jgi:hypothetical protein